MKMYKFLFLSVSLLLSTALSGQQKDTVYIETSEVYGALTDQNLVDAREMAYRPKEPARLMVKMDLAKMIPNLGAELKIGKSFSVNTGLEFGTRYLGHFNKSFSAFVEPRWYMGMARRIRSGRQANNLSGYYAGLELGYTHFAENYRNHERSAQLFLGRQGRFLNHGFFDIGFGAGVSELLPIPFARGTTMFSSRTRTRFGLATIFPKTKKLSENCDVLRCFREERHMWKVDLINLLTFQAYDGVRLWNSKTSLAFEQKLGASPFSVHTALQFGLQHNTLEYGPNETLHARTFEYGFLVQPRWYFTQKRRIAAGRSGNNLSGLYAGAQANYRLAFYKNNETTQFEAANFNYDEWFFAPVAGIQHRFLRNGYVDFTITGNMTRGGQIFDERGNYLLSYVVNNRRILYLMAEMRIGWAW